MNFPDPLLRGRLIRRYKRFLADVDLDGHGVVTAHVPNTGSMMGLDLPGSPVLVSVHEGKQRKLPYTLELVESHGGWVGVNTSLPNRIVEEAIVAGRIPSLRRFARLRREVRYGERSRIDLLLENGGEKCFIEVKNVTLRAQGSRLALFPDAVTERGRRHLLDLADEVLSGNRAVMFFLVNRPDCTRMAPAEAIDPAYAEALRRAVREGVEVLAYRTRTSPEGITVDRKVPVLI